MEFAADVLICGAGPAGLTLAIDLARRGASFRLIDRVDSPFFRGSYGTDIRPRTQEIFEDLGIIDRIVAAGGLCLPEREYRADGSFTDSNVVDDEDPRPAEPYRFLLRVPQFLTESVMRERLVEFGHQPEFGCELVGLDQDEDGVIARLSSKAGQKVIRVRYLVGADGGGSFVRHALGIGFPGETLDAREIVAMVVLTGLERAACHRFNEGSTGRHMLLCPLGETGLFHLQASIPLDHHIDFSPEWLSAMVAERAGRDIHIRAMHWASAYKIQARLADRYRIGRVFLVGDAAHIHPPTGGQGLNTGVQDSYNLGWKLGAALAGAADSLLDSYEAERRPIAASMLGLTTKLIGAAKRDEMRRGREVHHFDVIYPEPSLVLEKPERRVGLHAGDRAPDAPIGGAAGQATRLFQMFKGSHWTLFGYDVQRDAVLPRPGLHIHTVGSGGDIIDQRGDLRDSYGLASGDWVLVRPDGYIGAIVSSSELGALERYFRDIGLRYSDIVPSTVRALLERAHFDWRL